MIWLPFDSPFHPQEQKAKPVEKPAKKKPARKKPSQATTERRAQAKEQRAVKANQKLQAEQRRGPTEPAGPVPPVEDQVRSDLVVAGHELRVGVEEPKHSKAREKRETKAFADASRVDVLEVASDTTHTIVRFDDVSFTLDVQQSLALSRLLDSACVNLNH